LDELARTNERAGSANVDAMLDPRFVDAVRESGLTDQLYSR
jgi:hypothetical protein